MGTRTITNTLNEYLKDPASNLRTPTSRQSRRGHLTSLVRSAPTRPLRRWTEAQVLEVVAAPHLAKSSQITYRNAAMAFFSWCEWKGYIDHDPTKHLGRLLRPSVQPVREKRWLSREEVRAMFDACDDGTDTGRRDLVLLTLGFNSGLRNSEMGALTWADVGAQALTVRGKGEKTASVPISAGLRAALDEWDRMAPPSPQRAAQPVLCRVYTDPRGGNRFLAWGTPLGKEGVRGAVHRRAREAGLGVVNPHDMRRTFAGILDADGVPIQDISKLLRHSSVSTTQGYLSDSPHRAQTVMSTFQI